MSVVITATPDTRGGVVLTCAAPASAREFVWYADTMTTADCLALTTQPRLHVPSSGSRAFYVLVRDALGTTIGTAQAVYAASGAPQVLASGGAGSYAAGTPDFAGRNRATIPLPSASRVGGVALNVSGAALPGNILVWSRRTGGAWDLAGCGAVRTAGFAMTDTARHVTPRSPRAALYLGAHSTANPTTATFKPVIAHLEPGTDTAHAWMHDALGLYHWYFLDVDPARLLAPFGASKLTDTKAAMDAVAGLSMWNANMTTPAYLNLLESAVAEVKAANPHLDQAYRVKVFPLYCLNSEFTPSPQFWGALTLAEIQALNARGAAIPEALAEVTLSNWVEADLTTIQKYWYFKTFDWFIGHTHIEFGGLHNFSEVVSPTGYVNHFTAAFKTWLDANTAHALTGFGMPTGGNPFTQLTYPSRPSPNPHFHQLYGGTGYGFYSAGHPWALDARSSLSMSTLTRGTSNVMSGHSLELDTQSWYDTGDGHIEQGVWKNLLHIASAEAYAGLPNWTYFDPMLRVACESTDPRLRAVYTRYCEYITGRAYSRPLGFWYHRPQDGNRIAIAGMDTIADEVRVEWYDSTGTVTLTGIDVLAAPDTPLFTATPLSGAVRLDFAAGSSGPLDCRSAPR